LREQKPKVDRFGWQLKSIHGVAGGHITAMHDDIVNAIAAMAKEAGLRVRGGFGNTCKDMFKHCLKHDPEENDNNIQGILPDIYIDATAAVQVGNEMDGQRVLFDVKTVSPSEGYRSKKAGRARGMASQKCLTRICETRKEIGQGGQ
jgi:hypothetical protein